MTYRVLITLLIPLQAKH